MKQKRSFSFDSIKKGYIFIPTDQFGNKRDVFIQRCYRTKKVSLVFDEGGFAHNCLISLDCLKQIEFPQEKNKVGSTVLCYIDNFRKKPMIFSVFSKEDDIILQKEFDKKLTSINGENKAEIIVRGKTGELILNVDSEEDSGGKFTLVVKNKNKKANLNIRVLGDATVYGENAITLKSVNTITLDAPAVSASTSISADEDNITLNPNQKVILFTGSQPLVKGTEIKNQLTTESQALTDFLNAFNNLVPVAVPPSSVDPTWATLKAAIISIISRANWTNINSEKAFTD